MANLSGMFSNLLAATQTPTRQVMPTDPSQMNTLYERGVTNPMLQMFGKGLASLAGTDIRTQPQIQAAEAKALQQQAGQLYGQMAGADPQKQLELAKALAGISGYEEAGVRLAQQAQQAFQTQQQEGLQKEAVLTRINESALPQEEKNQMIKDYMSGITSAEDVISKFAPLSAKDRFKTVGNNIFDVKEERFLSAEEANKVKTSTPLSFDAAADLVEKGFITEQSYEDAVKSNDITLIDLVQPPKEGKPLSATVEKILNTTTETRNKHEGLAAKATELASKLEQYQPVAGTAGELKEFIKGVTGGEDIETLIRREAQQVVNAQAVQNLPVGPASDKDVALVLKGELPAGANAETLASYMRGIAKANQAIAAYQRRKALWIDKKGSTQGFETNERKNALKERIAATNPEAIAQIKASLEDPNLSDYQKRGLEYHFQQAYGYKYSDTVNELNFLTEGE